MDAGEMGLESKPQAFLKVDRSFIQSIEHRQNTEHSDFTRDQIPLIDLYPLNSTTPRDPTILDSLVTQIHAACRDWEFFQVINHGVSLHRLHSVQSETARFFSLPMQEKTKVRRDFDHPCKVASSIALMAFRALKKQRFSHSAMGFAFQNCCRREMAKGTSWVPSRAAASIVGRSKYEEDLLEVLDEDH